MTLAELSGEAPELLLYGYGELTSHPDESFPKEQWFKVNIDGVADFCAVATDEEDALIAVSELCVSTFPTLGLDPNTFDMYQSVKPVENDSLPIWQHRKATLGLGKRALINEIFRSFPAQKAIEIPTRHIKKWSQLDFELS